MSPIDGKVLGRVPGGSQYRFSEPIPGKPGKFRHDDLFVDAEAMTATTAGIMAVVPDHVRDDSIARLDDSRTARWTRVFSSVRPPFWAEENGIVAVATRQGLVGIKDNSGEEVWHSDGPSDRLIAAHGLVVATGHDSIVARGVSDGVEKWRASWPKRSDPRPTIATGDLFVVGNEGGGSDGWTRAYSTDGALQFALDGETVLAAHQISPGGDVIVVAGSRSKPGPLPGRVGNYYSTTSSRTARLNRNGQEIWHATPPIPADSHTPPGIYQLPNGSLLVETHSWIADSGVHLTKLDASTGVVAWQVYATPLGVGHSAYSHDVYVETRGDELILVSQASGGHFVERRSVADGALLQRWQFGWRPD